MNLRLKKKTLSSNAFPRSARNLVLQLEMINVQKCQPNPLSSCIEQPFLWMSIDLALRVITILCHNGYDDDNDASCCSVEHYYSIIMSKRSE